MNLVDGKEINADLAIPAIDRAQKAGDEMVDRASRELSTASDALVKQIDGIVTAAISQIDGIVELALKSIGSQIEALDGWSVEYKGSFILRKPAK